MTDTQYTRVVRKFRNQKHFCEVTGFAQQTVSAWAKSGTIPSKHHEGIIEKARDEGIDLSLLDFIPRAIDLIAPRSKERGAA